MRLQRALYTFSLMCFVCTIALADPPKLEIPSEIKATGEYVTLVPITDAGAIAYVGLSGVDPFPSGMLKDSRTFLLATRGLKEGRYKFTAVGIKDNEYTRKDFVIVVGEPVTPTPVDPKVDPIPEPDPVDAAPTPTKGMYVVILYETGNRLTQNQFNIMYGAKVRKWLEDNTEKINDNAQYRLIDKDQIPQTSPWKNIAARKPTTVPWIMIVSNKRYVYEGALPDVTEDKFIELISKYIPKSK